MFPKMLSNFFSMPDIEAKNWEEKKATKELEERMKNDLPAKLREDPSLYRRFLIARDFDVDKAEKMLRKHIRWRKSYQLDTLLEDFKPREAFVKYYEPSLLGHDKDGDIVVYTSIGKIEPKDIFKVIKMNELLKSVVWFGEKIFASLQKYNEKTGKNASRMSIIFDLDELSLANVTSKMSAEFMLRFVHKLQDNLPERVKSVFVINAPSYFMLFFSMLKAVMTKAMIEKYSSFGRSGWREVLLQHMDADILPVFLGGTRTDPDGNPKCYTFVRQGGKTSEIYFLSDEERYFRNTDLVKRVLIPPTGKQDIPIEITENGSRIHWRFLVKGRDIGFGLSFQVTSSEVEEVLPVERICTVDGTEECFYRCSSVGKYIVTFDNTHSWMTSKEVEYCISVLKDE